MLRSTAPVHTIKEIQIGGIIIFTITIDDAITDNLERQKRNKGHSILEVPSDYIILDLETTGLNPAFNEIIEVACVHMIDGKQTDTFHSYVQPTPFMDEGKKCYVDDFISSLTGITDDMLQDAPKFKDIAKGLFQYLKGATIIGHNVNFDINFLYDNFLHDLGEEFNNDFVDTMRMARIALPELHHHRLKDLSKLFNITGTQHRAMNDCQITHEILINLLSIIRDKQIDLSTYNHRHQVDLRDLAGDTTLHDISHPFYGKNCVFTGKLQRYVRKDAAQIVCNIGGKCENGVTKNTNYLIIGGFDGNPLVKGGKSGKMKKAEKLILEGQDLQILSEETFYDLLNDYLKN